MDFFFHFETGHWFDNKTTYIETNYTVDKARFAPRYLLHNTERFKYLLAKNAAIKHRSDESNLFIDNKIT